VEGRVVTAAPELIEVSGGHSFLECPRWHDGHLYASDFFTREVLRWGDDGPPETVVTVPHQPAGLGWAPDGGLLVVSMTDRRLLRWDGRGLAEVADLRGSAPWHCNDMVVDGAGRAYVGNFGWDEQTDPVIVPTMLHRVDPDGSVHIAAEGLVCPNGMAITPDGRTLLVAESFAARITAFDRAPDGSLSNRRVWAAFADREFDTLPDALDAGVLIPDGIALDAAGCLWVADCVGTAVSRVAEGGDIVDVISTGDRSPVAVALGGPELRTLFICASERYPYRRGHPRDLRSGQMLRIDVATAAA
jgi:sugar lactone lactonase YvrE